MRSQALLPRDISSFGFDPEKRLFTVGDESVGIGDLYYYQVREAGADIDQLCRTEGLVIDSRMQLYQLPRLSAWFRETPPEEKQAVFDAAGAAAHLVFNIGYNVTESARPVAGHGFTVSEDDQTLDITICTHVTMFVPAESRKILRQRGFIEYSTNNADLPIDEVILLAGAAVVADACRLHV